MWIAYQDLPSSGVVGAGASGQIGRVDYLLRPLADLGSQPSGGVRVSAPPLGDEPRRVRDLARPVCGSGLAIGEDGHAVVEDRAARKSESGIAALREQRLAASQNDRMDPEAQLVEEARLEEPVPGEAPGDEWEPSEFAAKIGIATIVTALRAPKTPARLPSGFRSG